MRWILDVVCRWPWLGAGALLIVLGMAAFLTVTAGLVPIKASSGHWPITEVLLHFAMQRSVITHSLLAPAPPEDIDSRRMVLRGAGHFETACRPCHGAPGDRPPVIANAMTPKPPPLGPRVGTWDAGELFYIVKHGVKFTGMPAWPTLQRDDEVWAMVGFLRQLPEMQADTYEALVRGEGARLTDLLGGGANAVEPPDLVLEVCARCHGVDGQGRGGAFPKLAGQRLEYMARALHAYAAAERFSGMMQPVAANLPEEPRHRALAYYAGLPPMMPTGSADAQAVARGRALAITGLESEGIPACASCHQTEGVNEAYPRLMGQNSEYIAQQLRLLQQRRRGGSEFVHIMHNFVDRLTTEQIEVLAAFFSAGAP